MDGFAVELGKRIRACREALGINQRDLAAALDVKPPTITMYESGTRSPSNAVLVAMAKRLGTTTDYLLGASDQRDIFVDEEIVTAFRQFALLSPRDRRVVMEVIRALGAVPL
ncbi:helix-turn-helix domain-containing protein [Geobacter grbiciae]|uniref:helix-turn-helix domain-containing protein n=1 Tax=Geobacter grbiciae TaxID=155042 RepID=UPI001C0364FC|nr:helix-turn-helix transcriptional regulator [Geobacter grbiciae]MBT1073967.1 helix-turn-helix domain-containing protein [Geobacter grbiciae]